MRMFDRCVPVGFSDFSDVGDVCHVLGDDGVVLYVVQFLNASVNVDGVCGLLLDGVFRFVFSTVVDIRRFVSLHNICADVLVYKGILRRDFTLLVLPVDAPLPLFEQSFDFAESSDVVFCVDDDRLRNICLSVRNSNAPDNNRCLSFACSVLTCLAAPDAFVAWNYYGMPTAAGCEYAWLSVLSRRLSEYGVLDLRTAFGVDMNADTIWYSVKSGYAVMMRVASGTDIVFPGVGNHVISSDHAVCLVNVDAGDLVMFDQMGIRRCNMEQLEHICVMINSSDSLSFLVGVRLMRKSLAEIKDILFSELLENGKDIVIDTHDGKVYDSDEIAVNSLADSFVMRVDVSEVGLYDDLTVFCSRNSRIILSESVHAGIAISDVNHSDLRDLSIVDEGLEPSVEYELLFPFSSSVDFDSKSKDFGLSF